VICDYEDPRDDCKVLTKGFLGVTERGVFTPFHDEQLEQATLALNAMIAKMHPPEGQALAILNTPDGPFLAWVKEVGIGSADLRERIEEGLGIQAVG
jgi:hypothetical protein